MDGPRSFYKDRDALEQVVESEKVAFVQVGEPINFHEDYHCKVVHSNYLNFIMLFQYLLFAFQIYSVWKDHMPIYTISMYMKKHSPLTPFIAHGIRKMAETGITNLHSKRHIVSEPNCKPLQSKGRTLGLEKFASLFTFYIIGCIVSLIILVIENIHKPFSSKKKSQVAPSMQSLKKEKMMLRIDALKYALKDAITTYHHKNSILLETEKMELLNMKIFNLKEII